MSEDRILGHAQTRLIPWRNGRGMTREWLVLPATASMERLDFDLRISAAAVTDDGPFSRFPGYQRLLIITSGIGLSLQHNGEPAYDLKRGAVARFHGADETRARLLGGSVQDFGVIYRPQWAEVEADVLTENCRSIRPGPGLGFVLCLEGHVHLRAGTADMLPLPMDHAWIGRLQEELVVDARSGNAILVRIVGPDVKMQQ